MVDQVVIFKIDRECTGDSVVSLDEDIRLLSAEWQWEIGIGVTDLETAMHLHPLCQLSKLHANNANEPSSS